MSNYWLFLSSLFIFLSLDESLSIHEEYNRIHKFFYNRNLIPNLGINDSWIFVGLFFVVIVIICLFPLLISLPKKTLFYFLLSGIIFIIGAIGFEFIGIVMREIGLQRMSFIYLIRILIEEGLEMSGIAIFNCVLYHYISRKKISLMIDT